MKVKRFIPRIVSLTVMLLSVFVATSSCNEIEDLNKGWWYYTATYTKNGDSTDYTEIENAINATGLFMHNVTVYDAQNQWDWFLQKVDDSKVVTEGDDHCTVTLTWDSDYENPGIQYEVIGSKTWANKSEAQNY